MAISICRSPRKIGNPDRLPSIVRQGEKPPLSNLTVANLAHLVSFVLRPSAPLGLRLLLAYEFWVAGVEKLNGNNRFADIQDQMPFPFSVVPAEVSWFLATWTELIGSALLAVGLGTRFWALSLAVLDIVAWARVHAGHGYNVCDNGYKLPLMYLVMLVALILTGPGKASLDALVWRRLRVGA